MDDRKMKIKIVVRPEDEQKAAAAVTARQARQKRARWGIAALIGLVALSAAIALFFIGRGPTPGEREEPPLASAPGAAGSAADQERPAEPRAGATADGRGEGQGSADAGGAGVTAGEAGDAAVDEASSAQGEPALPPPVPGAPPAASADARPDNTAAAPGAASTPAPTARVPEAAPPPSTAGGPEAPIPSAGAHLPGAAQPAPAGGGEAAKAPVVAKAPAAKPSAGVIRAELASGVVNREPKGALRSPVDVGAGGKTVFYFNEFRNLNGQTVAHRWEYNGRVVATIPLRIEGNRWRVYSSKRIGQNQLGEWRVSAVDRSGAVLAQAQFRAE
jgi:hypothetical protein